MGEARGAQGCLENTTGECLRREEEEEKRGGEGC